jgi:hypothetical protein
VNMKSQISLPFDVYCSGSAVGGLLTTMSFFYNHGEVR